MNNEPKFSSGPLFIIGMPRSGTKLLTHLLNNHNKVNLVHETEFLPYYIKNWKDYGDISIPENFHSLYSSFLQTSFFMKRRRRGDLLDEETWYEMCKSYSFSLRGVFESLIRYYTNSLSDKNSIWGDKSPSYLKYISLLKDAFPESKFIHIIRDVRDCSLSAYNAWGKNMMRYAQRWNDTMLAVKEASQQLSDKLYFELKYEELVTNSSKMLGYICEFLGIEYSENLLEFDANTENRGDAAGYRRIKTNNIHKYKNHMSATTVNKIETITVNTLKKYSYQCSYQGPAKTIPYYKMKYYQIKDLFNLIIYEINNSDYRNIIYFIRINIAHYQK